MKKKNQNLVVSILFLVLFIVSLISYFKVANSLYWLLLAVLAISSSVFAFITYLYDLNEKKQFLIVSLFFILFGFMYFIIYLGDRNSNNIFWIVFSIFFALFNFWHYLRASDEAPTLQSGSQLQKQQQDVGKKTEPKAE